MLIERYNETAALAALAEESIETRVCVSVQPTDTVYRFVRDNVGYTLNGWDFEPVPFAQFDPIASDDGSVADTTTITLDGKYFLTVTDNDPSDVFRTVLQHPLRDRPIQIGLLVLNTDTKEAIGVIPQFVGFIDNAPLTRSKDSAILEINCASFRAFAQRRVTRTYSDTDHRSRFPGDGACKWIADAVFRSGKYIWNRTSGQGQTSGNVSGPGGGFNDNFRTFSF
jgi:hypothetical protein